MMEDNRYIRLNEAFLYVDDVFLDIVEREKRAGQMMHKKDVAHSNRSVFMPVYDTSSHGNDI